MVYFVGAGSGAADLITVRGARLLGEADVVIYAGSLVNPALLQYTREGCEIHNSAEMTLEQVLAVVKAAEAAGKTTVRLHTGDSSIYGAVREQFDQRKPDMGIVCWQSGEKMWIAISTDAKADYNGTLFQLKLGAWPNREMQKAFTDDPDSFQWSLLKRLDYKEREEDHRDDLELLFLMCMEEYPQAQRMRPGKR